MATCSCFRAFIALLLLLLLTQTLAVPAALAFGLVLFITMALTALWNFAIERVAYRRLRGSFRLAPLISAIGMSTFLANFVTVTQGPNNKSIPPVFDHVIAITHGGAYDVTLSYKQILIVAVTAVLLAAFWFVVQKTSLGRAQRACEQDAKMAALLGVDVDSTIALTFVIGAALAAVAGCLFLLHYGVVKSVRRFRPRREGLHRRRARRHWLAARRRAGRAGDRPDRNLVGAVFLQRLQGCGGFLHSGHNFDLHAFRPARPARRGKGVT